MPTIDLDGVRTHYERYGEGPPLVFSHGSGWDARSWMPQVRGLSTDYEVVVYDVRGHGESGSPHEELDDLTVLADDLAALVEQLNLDSPVVAGCSMGGRIAYTYAARHPDALDGLITLEAPVADGGLSWRTRSLFWAIRELGRVVGPNRVFDAVATARSLLTESDPYADQRVAGLGMTKATYIDSAREKFDGAEQLCWLLADRGGIDLSAVRVPTLVLTGTDPSQRYEEAAQRLVTRIPDARRETIPDAGHGAHMDNPVEFNRAVRLFLSEIDY